MQSLIMEDFALNSFTLSRHGNCQMLPRIAVLFSGGWDSTYCLIKAIKKHEFAMPCFFDYGQNYFESEKKATSVILGHLKMTRITLEIPSMKCVDGIFDNRNERLLQRVVEALDPQEVYFGCRNPLARFDKYGDSNWQWAQKMEKKYGIKMRTPCVLLPKWLIRRSVIHKGIREDWIFSTEGLS
jgi:hypothetical protein